MSSAAAPAVAGPSTGAPSARTAQKRRLSEPPESSAQPAKRARSGEELGEPRGRDGPQENTPPGAKTAHGGAAAKEKKKRRKKKKKVPVVQQGERAGESASADAMSPVQHKKKQDDSRCSSQQKQSTPGPSRRSLSKSPQRLKSPSIEPTSKMPEAPVRSSLDLRTFMRLTALQTFTTQEKGKGRAVSPDADAISAQADAAALIAHRDLLSTLFPSLTCQICLLLMHRPFALSPCGHVSCHACLVNWFSNDPGVLGQAIPQAEPPPPARAPENADANPNAEANAAANAPAPAAPAAGAAPRAHIPLVRRKKTCPHCRAVVREKPVEVWSVKDMVAAVARSGLADPDAVPLALRADAPPGADGGADPWGGIFPGARGAGADPLARESMGIRDDEDGGVYRCVDCTHEIWDGVCSHCGRFYPGHRAELDSDGLSDDGAPFWFDDDGEGLDDDDDDEVDDVTFVRRFMRGARLGRLGVHLDDTEDEEGAAAPRFEPPGLRWFMDGGLVGSDGHGSDEDTDIAGSAAHISDEEHSEGEGEDEEEGYESSFIDDDDDEVEVLEVAPAAGRRQARSTRPSAIVISSDEDEDDADEDDEGSEG